MGGSASLHWNHRKYAKEPRAPWFTSDSKAWAEWVVNMRADEEVLARLEALELRPLVYAIAVDFEAEEWATPDELETAARKAHQLLAAGDARVQPLLAVYAEHGYGDDVEENRAAMAQDPLDIAAMAAWARF